MISGFFVLSLAAQPQGTSDPVHSLTKSLGLLLYMSIALHNLFLRHFPHLAYLANSYSSLKTHFFCPSDYPLAVITLLLGMEIVNRSSMKADSVSHYFVHP